MSLETALLKIIHSNRGSASTTQIYSALEQGKFFNLLEHHLKETIHGGRPAYQHEVRSYLSSLVKKGFLIRVSRGNFAMTEMGKSEIGEKT